MKNMNPSNEHLPGWRLIELQVHLYLLASQFDRFSHAVCISPAFFLLFFAFLSVVQLCAAGAMCLCDDQSAN